MTKFHINKHGVPAPCRASKGKCPLGGESGSENHFDNYADAQRAVDNQHEKENGFIPNISESGTYNGDEFSASVEQNDRLKRDLSPDNVGEVLSEATEDKNITFDFKTESFNNTPVEFSAEVENMGDGKFKIYSKKSSYFMAEEDFDSEEEYEDYLAGGPDDEVEYSYEFTAEELKRQVPNKQVDGEKAPGAMYSAIYGLDSEKGE